MCLDLPYNSVFFVSWIFFCLGRGLGVATKWIYRSLRLLVSPSIGANRDFHMRTWIFRHLWHGGLVGDDELWNLSNSSFTDFPMKPPFHGVHWSYIQTVQVIQRLIYLVNRIIFSRLKRKTEARITLMRTHNDRNWNG